MTATPYVAGGGCTCVSPGFSVEKVLLTYERKCMRNSQCLDAELVVALGLLVLLLVGQMGVPGGGLGVVVLKICE